MYFVNKKVKQKYEKRDKISYSTRLFCVTILYEKEEKKAKINIHQC